MYGLGGQGRRQNGQRFSVSGVMGTISHAVQSRGVLVDTPLRVAVLPSIDRCKAVDELTVDPPRVVEPDYVCDACRHGWTGATILPSHLKRHYYLGHAEDDSRFELIPLRCCPYCSHLQQPEPGVCRQGPY